MTHGLFVFWRLPEATRVIYNVLGVGIIVNRERSVLREAGVH